MKQITRPTKNGKRTSKGIADLLLPQSQREKSVASLFDGDPSSAEIATHWAGPKESKTHNPNFEPETQRDSKDQVVEV